MDYEKKYKEALSRAKEQLEGAKVFDYKEEQIAHDIRETIHAIFPLLKESEDERIRKAIMDFIDTNTIDSDERRNRWFSYLEKYKPISFTSLKDTKVKMSLMQYISELNQDVVHLHPCIETCNEWLSWLEKQGEQKPIEWDADDDDKFIFLKARLKDYEDYTIYDEELSEWQKSNVRETTKEFLEWLDSIKERIGG